MKIEKKITELLITHLQPTQLKVENVTAKHHGHAGHAEAGGGAETHFELEITSPHFEGMSKLQMHKAVNTLLAPLFDEGLHALALKTKKE